MIDGFIVYENKNCSIRKNVKSLWDSPTPLWIWWLPDSPRYRAAVRGGFSRSRPMMTMHLWHFLGVMLTCLATSLPRVDGKMRQVTRNWLNLIAALLPSGHEDRQRPRRLRRRCGRCHARRACWRPALLIAKPISLTTGNRDQLIKEIGNVWPVQSQVIVARAAMAWLVKNLWKDNVQPMTVVNWRNLWNSCSQNLNSSKKFVKRQCPAYDYGSLTSLRNRENSELKMAPKKPSNERYDKFCNNYVLIQNVMPTGAWEIMEVPKPEMAPNHKKWST